MHSTHTTVKVILGQRNYDADHMSEVLNRLNWEVKLTNLFT
jgi:hypothetical protein